MAITLVFLLSIILHYFSTVTAQECPYPCFPPPTNPGNNPSVGITPPVATTPPAAGTFSPPAGIYPYTPPAPNYFGGGPPPPDPIVPWFPFYYRKPPHGGDSQYSTARTIKEGCGISIVLVVLVLSFVFN